MPENKYVANTETSFNDTSIPAEKCQVGDFFRHVWTPDTIYQVTKVGTLTYYGFTSTMVVGKIFKGQSLGGKFQRLHPGSWQNFIKVNPTGHVYESKIQKS